MTSSPGQSKPTAEPDPKRISAVKSMIPLLWLGLVCGPIMLWVTYPVLSSVMIGLFVAAIASLIGTLIYVHKKAKLWASGR